MGTYSHLTELHVLTLMMTLSSSAVFNAIVLGSGVRAMAVRELEVATYVYGGENLGACPAGYVKVDQLTHCSAAQAQLSLPYAPREVDDASDAPGCFVHDDDNYLFFNTNAAGPAGGHSDGRRYICMFSSFQSFTGDWVWVGAGLAATTQTAEVSWSTTEDSSTTDSFTTGLEEGVEAGFMGTGISLTTSQEWSSSVTKSISNMEGGASSYSCQALSCEQGNLWQWQITGSASTGGDDHNTQCSFTCISQVYPKDVQPKCPAGYCGDDDCQCCSGDSWATNGETVPLCDSPTDAPNLTATLGTMCLGCDK